MSNMSALTRPQKVALSLAIDVIPVDAVFYPENNAEEADLSKVEETTWVNLARCKQMQFNQDRQADEEDSYDANTLTRVKVKNETVVGNSYTADMERTSLLFDAMSYGVPNPFSEEAADLVASGKPFRIHATNKTSVPVGVRMREYDGNRLMCTRWFYADASAEAGKTFDGKIVRPKLKLDVQASVWNMAQNDPNYTGQAVQE